MWDVSDQGNVGLKFLIPAAPIQISNYLFFWTDFSTFVVPAVRNFNVKVTLIVFRLAFLEIWKILSSNIQKESIPDAAQSAPQLMLSFRNKEKKHNTLDVNESVPQTKKKDFYGIMHLISLLSKELNRFPHTKLMQQIEKYIVLEVYLQKIRVVNL